MPLYDVTHEDTLVDPKIAEEYEHIQALRRKLHPATYDRVWKTVREAVDSVRPSSLSKLVWTKMAALFGELSGRPKRDVDHLWDAVVSAVGDDKECLIAVGALLRAVIAERAEIWLVYRRETGDVDPFTGKKITVSEYWIDENYVYKPKPRRPRAARSTPATKTYCGTPSLGEQLAQHFTPSNTSRILVRRRNGVLVPSPNL